MSNFYILDEEGNPKKTDLMSWAHTLENNDDRWQVGLTKGMSFSISTRFLGLCHKTAKDKGDPTLWETLVRDNDGEEVFLKRYDSLEKAKKGHEECVVKYCSP